MGWKDNLKAGSIDFIQQIIDQVPAEQGVQNAFVVLLDRLADTPTPAQAARLEILDALEAGGVDNWDGYHESLDDAGLLDEDEDED